MEHNYDDIDRLIFEYCSRMLSASDRAILEEWVNESSENRKRFRKAVRLYYNIHAVGSLDDANNAENNIWEKIRKDIVLEKNYSGVASGRSRILLFVSRFAAVLLLLLGIFWWLNKTDVETVPEKVIAQSVSDIPAGSPKAILRLSTGEELALGAGETCKVTEMEGFEVLQDSAGGIRIQGNLMLEGEHTPTYHTVIVPTGGEYFAQLSDGTRIWLNSESELTFPSHFSGSRREVALKGEAYFEVVSDPEHPFYVEAGGTCIRVLGTSFNISSYREDADVSVALLNGKVDFDVFSEKYSLTPGQIASFNKHQRKVTIESGNIESVIAWKSGVFNFDNMQIADLTAKLGRWYGVNFQIDPACRDLFFTGVVTKYRPISYILDIISKTTFVEFRESERLISVCPRKG